MLKIAIILSGLFLMGYACAWYAATPALRRVIGPAYVANFLIIVLAAAVMPNAQLFALIVLLSTVATTRDARDAICRFALLTPLLPAINMVFQIGGLYLGIYHPIAALGIATLISCFAKSSGRLGRPIRGFTAEDGLVLLLFLIFTVATSRFADVRESIRVIMTGATTMLLPYWLFRNYVRTPEDTQRIIACLLVAGISVMVIACYEVRFTWVVYEPLVRRLSQANESVIASSQMRGNSLRASVAFNKPLVLAYFLMVMVIASFCAKSWFQPKRWRLGIAFILFSFVLPQSRGAFVAIVPGMIVLLVARRRFGAAAGLLAASGVGALSLTVLQHSSARIAAFVGSGDGQHYDYRQGLFERGMQEGAKHPVFGQSMASVLASLDDIRQGEGLVDLVNTYLTIYLVSGLVGFGAFVVLTAITLRKLVARARRSDDREVARYMRAFLLASITSTLFYLTSMSFIERVPVFFVILLASSRTISAALVRPTRKITRTIPVPAGDHAGEDWSRLSPA